MENLLCFLQGTSVEGRGRGRKRNPMKVVKQVCITWNCNENWSTSHAVFAAMAATESRCGRDGR